MVDETKQKAVKIAFIVIVISFVFGVTINWLEKTLPEGYLSSLAGSLIFGLIAFFSSKSAIKNKVEFKWWQWIFYIMGWLAGFANLLFWLIMYGIHMACNYGDPFFSKDFHRRVYVWGIVITIILIIFTPLIFFL